MECTFFSVQLHNFKVTPTSGSQSILADGLSSTTRELHPEGRTLRAGKVPGELVHKCLIIFYNYNLCGSYDCFVGNEIFMNVDVTNGKKKSYNNEKGSSH